MGVARCRRWAIGASPVALALSLAASARAESEGPGMQSPAMFTTGVTSIGIGIAAVSVGPVIAIRMCSDSCPGTSVFFSIASPALGGASVIAGLPLAIVGAARPDGRSSSMVGGGAALITLGVVTMSAGATVALFGLGARAQENYAAAGISALAIGNAAIAGGITMYTWGNEPDEARLGDAGTARRRSRHAGESFRLVPTAGGMALSGRF